MTLAAKELHLTQSGVSQHIKSLEEVLEIPLFDRIKQKLVPTSSGRTLFEACSQGLTELETALWNVKGGTQKLSGRIAIGMPIEFGNSILSPLLLRFSKKHPDISYKAFLGYASDMNQLLLDGVLDFAFVDEFKMDPRIKSEKVFDEILELWIHEDLLKSKGPIDHPKKYFESLEVIELKEDAPLLRQWFHHHYKMKNLKLQPKMTLMDVPGVAKYICGGMGAGILPTHMGRQLQKAGEKIQNFKGSGKPLKNTISVTYLKDRTQSLAAKSLLDFLKSQLSKG